MQDSIGNSVAPTSHRFDSQRLSLHYLDWGNAGKPVLLLVHGSEDHAHSWDWVAERLRDDWHVIALDLRGHGDSDWSPDGAYTIEYMVADLAALVRHLAVEEVSIVAHSYGAGVSLRYAGLFPETVRRLVAIEGLTSWDEIRVADNLPDHSLAEKWRAWVDKRLSLAAATPRHYPDVETATARMKARNRHLSDDQARHLAYWGLKPVGLGDYAWKFDVYLRSWHPIDPTDMERRALWGAITCPLLLFHGQDSWASNPAEDGRADFFRDARVISLEGAGHWVHHDRLESFVEAVRAFL